MAKAILILLLLGVGLKLFAQEEDVPAITNQQLTANVAQTSPVPVTEEGSFFNLIVPRFVQTMHQNQSSLLAPRVINNDNATGVRTTRYFTVTGVEVLVEAGAHSGRIQQVTINSAELTNNNDIRQWLFAAANALRAFDSNLSLSEAYLLIVQAQQDGSINDGTMNISFSFINQSVYRLVVTAI
ncbi:MAG: hypothetical protein FWE37_01640 [Spirochaetaceae bacterium]|nr:hypothetical protein [Spirochaetaceae bacterium]